MVVGQEALVRVESQKTADKGLDRKRLVAGCARHIFASAQLFLGEGLNTIVHHAVMTAHSHGSPRCLHFGCVQRRLRAVASALGVVMLSFKHHPAIITPQFVSICGYNHLSRMSVDMALQFSTAASSATILLFQTNAVPSASCHDALSPSSCARSRTSCL